MGNTMAGYCLIVLFAAHLGICSVASIYYPNHKYNFESENLSTKPEAENSHNFNLSDLHHTIPSNLLSSQLRRPIIEDPPSEDTNSEKIASKRKFTILDKSKTSTVKGKRRYENFVTPKGEDYKKGYEVTTKRFVDTEPEAITPSPLGLDNDVALALDDEDDESEEQPETPRPQKVYLDSYGRLHGGHGAASHGGHGYSYGVVHSKVPSRHLNPERVRMQVFRGPTRYVGHRRFAPWGYFVVQPADHGGPHRNPGPPYGYY